MEIIQGAEEIINCAAGRKYNI